MAAAGTGGATGKGHGSEAGVEGRATAAAAVSAGTGAEVPADSAETMPANELHGVSPDHGRSAEAPGQTGRAGLAQALLRADDHAEAGLALAQSNQDADDASDEETDTKAAPPK